MNGGWHYFEKNAELIENALKSIDSRIMDTLISECEQTLRAGNKIVVSGLGKNVPICEKFVGTMLSLGLSAGFLHTNSAVHGDMGMIRGGGLSHSINEKCFHCGISLFSWAPGTEGGCEHLAIEF